MKFKSPGSIFVLIVAPLMAFTTILVIFLLYYNTVQFKQGAAELDEKYNVALQQTIIAKDFQPVLSDLMILSQHHHLMEILGGVDVQKAKKLLTHNFHLFISQKKIYNQIRYLDENGMEIIRVNYKGGATSIVPEKQLQNKGDRYYFKKAFELEVGEFFVSPFDLNVEGGKVEVPFNPVIRFATPVFDKSGKKRGVMILNYQGAKLLHDLSYASENNLGQPMLLNPDGYWIHSPDPEDQWGFMFADKKNNVFKNRYPQAAEKIFSQDAGQIETPNGLFTFDTVYLFSGSDESQASNIKTDEYWKIVSYVTRESLRDATRKHINIFLLSFVFLAGLLVVTSLAMAQTMMKRMVAEEENKRLATIVKETAEAIMVTDSGGLIEYVNPAFEKITGYSQAEAFGKKANILKSGKHDKSFYEKMWRTITAGRVWTGNIVNKAKNGDLIEEETVITPLLDSSGEITNYIATKRDVSNEAKLENQLRQSQKMQAVGTLAGGIAHDFNNILAAVIGYTEMALDDVPEDSETHENLTEALKASIRAKELVKQILAFSRHGEQELKSVNLQVIAQESLKLLRASLPSTVDIVQSFNGNGGVVMADPVQMTQVIMNLCVNAGHAMEKGGRLTVGLDAVHMDKEVAESQQGLKKGNYMKLSVSDNGKGMDNETLDRIFEPFFTTKDVGEGTGLGLAMVHGIVTSHEGVISVHSEPGKGSTFDVYLPLIDGMDDTGAGNGHLVEPILTGKECVLFVDDEEQLVSMGKKQLKRLGYDVVTRTSPIEALEAFKSFPNRFDIVVTDQTMPGMSGAQLAEEILKIRPGVPVILLTGYSNTLTPDKARSIGVMDFVTKPVVIHDLAGAIRKALDS